MCLPLAFEVLAMLFGIVFRLVFERLVIFFNMIQIRETNSEMNKLVEKRMMTSDPADDKVSGVNLYRQQV